MKVRVIVTVIFLVLLIGCAKDYGYTESISSISHELNNTKQKGTTTDITARAYEPVVIYIRESLIFEPESIDINKGQSLIWKVNDNVQETLRMREQKGLFTSDELSANDVFTYTFNDEGKYVVELLNKGKSMTINVKP